MCADVLCVLMCDVCACMWCGALLGAGQCSVRQQADSRHTQARVPHHRAGHKGRMAPIFAA